MTVHLTNRALCLLLLVLGSSVALREPEGEECLKDVVFIVDVSESITVESFEVQKDFVKNITSELYMSEFNGSVIATLAFSRNVFGAGLLPFKNITILHEGIDGLPHEREGTHTHLALQRARDIITEQGRIGVEKLVVIISDGKSKFPERTIQEANAAKEEGISIVGVGVEDCPCASNIPELERITSPGKFYLIRSLQELSRLVSTIKAEICDGK
ncbi:collagen alpha-1(XXVIII) chain-like [Liolophura sinensis]|uniref:collagen alpha-1(XXVIII) chain-like n=1 Tax=Liolophura sinensis TaxID=3198878 RepID=UPI0031584222